LPTANNSASCDPRPTILITGGSSQIGRSVVRHLGASYRYVFLLHARPAPIAGPDVGVLPGGLAALPTHADAVRSADVVLHMAGLSHSRREDAYAEVNEQGTRALLAVGRTDQPIVYVSTRCAAPEAGGYGRSKYAAEQAIVASGRPYVIIRPAEVYGANAAEGIEALTAFAARRRLLVDFRWRRPVEYSPVSSEELGAFIANVVRGPLSGGRAYTICNDRSYTARDIQDALQRGLGKRIFRMPVSVGMLKALLRMRVPLPFAPDQLDRLIMAKSADNSAARRDYGFAPGSFLDYLERAYR
jgi:nucleoside-diphosphate-sugar epimerase